MGNTLRQLQMCELEMLKEVRTICEKYGLQYYLSAGTLLGAVRHQGFIPWDDDTDIEMPYSDYLRFLEVAPKELGDRYFLQNPQTDVYSHFEYTQVRKNNTTMMREWEKSFPGHHGVWLDIFPLIYVGNTCEYRLKRLVLEICTFLRMNDTIFSYNEKWYTSQSNALIIALIKIVRRLPRRLRWNIRDRAVKWICTCKEKPYICYPWSNLSKRIPKEAYCGTVMLKFEDDYFPAPSGYVQYLTAKYGDYLTLPPEEARTGHGNIIIDLERNWYCYSE